HPFGPLELSVREFLHALDQRVTIAFALGEDSQKQRPRGRGDEFTRRHSGLMPCLSRYVKQRAKFFSATFPHLNCDSKTGYSVRPVIYLDYNAHTPLAPA